MRKVAKKKEFIMKKIIQLFLLIGFVLQLSAQDFKKLMAEGTHTVEYIVEVAEQHFDSVGRERGTGYKPFRRWQYFAERAMDETGKLKSPEFTIMNYKIIVQE